MKKKKKTRLKVVKIDIFKNVKTTCRAPYTEKRNRQYPADSHSEICCPLFNFITGGLTLKTEWVPLDAAIIDAVARRRVLLCNVRALKLKLKKKTENVLKFVHAVYSNNEILTESYTEKLESIKFVI